MIKNNIALIEMDGLVDPAARAAKCLADYLAQQSGRSGGRHERGVFFARPDLFVALVGDDASAEEIALDRTAAAIILHWNARRPAYPTFDAIVSDGQRVDYFPDLYLQVDQAGIVWFSAKARHSVGIMVGKSGLIPGGTGPTMSPDERAAAFQRGLDALFADEGCLPDTPTSVPPQMAGAGLRTFLKIAQRWELGDEERQHLLGPGGKLVLEADAKGLPVTMAQDCLLRISAVLGIHAALESLLPGRAAKWLRHPNRAPLFEGRPAIELMCTGQLRDLLQVRNYLDSQLSEC